MNLSKLGPILKYIIAALGVLFYVLMLVAGDEVLETDPAAQAKYIDPAILITDIALILGVVISIGFAIYQIITHPKQARQAGIGIGFLGAVTLVAYLISSSKVTEKMMGLE